MSPGSVGIVVPTVGRPSLAALLRSLADADGPLPRSIVLVDDRRRHDSPLLAGATPARLADRVLCVRGRGGGPAAARNAGWRAAATDWVAFLDDDVVVARDWLARLADDLAQAGPTVAGVQGRLVVPLPTGRPPTDWERNVAGLERARWATADLAYRRDALVLAGGFDERFPRAYREDADLGLRLVERGFEITRGRRTIRHPVRPADRWVSVRLQAGNADDARMLLAHGRGWQARAGVPRGRRPQHLATTAAALAALGAGARGRRGQAVVAGALWLAATGQFAWDRIRPGPRTRGEIVTMALTSAVVPAAATWHWVRGFGPALRRPRGGEPPAAVLFDRDGTLVVDRPYNGDPDKVEPMPGAAEAVERLRQAGVATGVVSNQSGVARGLLDPAEVSAVNRRVDELLGPLAPWVVCPHAPDDGCACRKPAPGMVRHAAALLGVRPADCVVVGDIGSDVEAARAAGARSVLVPTPRTRAEEIAGADRVAADLGTAVDLILAGGV